MLETFDDTHTPVDIASQQRMRSIAHGVIGLGLLSWVIALAALPSIGGARWVWALGGAYVALVLYAIVGPKTDGGLPVPYNPQEELREARTPFRDLQELHDHTEELATWMDIAPVLVPPTLEKLAPAPPAAHTGRRFRTTATAAEPDVVNAPTRRKGPRRRKSTS